MRAAAVLLAEYPALVERARVAAVAAGIADEPAASGGSGSREGRGPGRVTATAIDLGDPLTTPLIPRQVDVGQALGRLSRVTADIAALELSRRRLVVELRGAGVSWHRLGTALGVTGEGARRRYAADVGLDAGP